MQAKIRIVILNIICLVSIFVLCGCTNWQKKYQRLNVECQNVKGLLERERVEKGQLVSQVTQGQKTIEQLQQQIAERNQSAGAVTGFGDDYDVKLDQTAGTITVTVSNSILFDAGKAKLKRTTSVELNHIESVLRNKYAGRQIDIVGHTDSDPIKKSKWKDNWELSSQRALSVVRYFVKLGIPKDSIRAVGCGTGRPIAPNATRTGKAKNRRVEIVVNMR